MPMMTAGQYEESLRRLNLVVYMFGERLETVVDDPIIRPSMLAVAKTYELAHRPEHEDIMTATSHITGKKINRFVHIHQSIDDLVKKSKMGRLLGRETGCCFQRCVGMDALNALSIVTHTIDKKYGTPYKQRFLKYLEYVQENDCTCDGAMTDPKGDRSLPPAQTAGPLPARGRRKRGRYCGSRRQGSPNRCRKFPRNHRHAHHCHAQGR